ncbi:N-acetylmuramoyl-L-alanine amidase [Leptospira ellinghausenii]|uniref:N-acetylmuramoyl-L-alanine amidase n=1 Tax=Leptospira ellinghausenii TaxID=1917822 RepID=A0A2P2DEF9_9LEPT|nr:hypothetical protein [Leptospira ellinghausenii]GBF43014.1 N-acetylmuramoyl-L-alanine amidase [Leptospira ellinghausenii]
MKEFKGNVLGDPIDGIAFLDIDLFKVDMESSWIAFREESIFFLTYVFFTK